MSKQTKRQVAVKFRVGNTVELDDGAWFALQASDWEAAQFRTQGMQCGYDLAVNVEQTGRKVHSVWPYNTYRVRVRVEFVGDGSPSTYALGWAYVASDQACN